MKKFIILFFLMLILFACGNKNETSEEPKFWLFNLGESKDEVLQRLKSSNYEIKPSKNDSIIDISNVQFLNTNWNSAGLSFNKDSLVSILLYKLQGPDINDVDKIKISTSIKENMDSIFLIKAENLSSSFAAQLYSWEDNNNSLLYIIISDGAVLMLNYSINGYEKLNPTYFNNTIKELEDKLMEIDKMSF